MSTKEQPTDNLGGELFATVREWGGAELLNVVAERSGPVAVFTAPDDSGILLATYGWWASWEVSDKGTLIVRDPRQAGRVIGTHETGRWGWVGHVKSIHHGPGQEF